MSDPKAYSLARLESIEDIREAEDKKRRDLARAALLGVLAEVKRRREIQITVGALSRAFDRQYHDLLYSLLSELTTERRVRFDPERPAPNRVEVF